MAGVCKHTCALSATNIIKTGERYGYAFYLLVQEFGPRNLKFSHIDVNCLHTPWREFTTNAFQVWLLLRYMLSNMLVYMSTCLVACLVTFLVTCLVVDCKVYFISA